LNLSLWNLSGSENSSQNWRHWGLWQWFTGQVLLPVRCQAATLTVLTLRHWLSGLGGRLVAGGGGHWGRWQWPLIAASIFCEKNIRENPSMKSKYSSKTPALNTRALLSHSYLGTENYAVQANCLKTVLRLNSAFFWIVDGPATGNIQKT
jgi:hypothetical protein